MEQIENTKLFTAEFSSKTEPCIEAFFESISRSLLRYTSEQEYTLNYIRYFRRGIITNGSEMNPDTVLELYLKENRTLIASIIIRILDYNKYEYTFINLAYKIGLQDYNFKLP